MDAITRVEANDYLNMFVNQIQIISSAMSTMLGLANDAELKCGVDLFDPKMVIDEDGKDTYPFSRSFDEVECEVSSWLFTLKNYKF